MGCAAQESGKGQVGRYHSKQNDEMSAYKPGGVGWYRKSFMADSAVVLGIGFMEAACKVNMNRRVMIGDYEVVYLPIGKEGRRW